MSELLDIESLDLEAHGVAHHDGKVVFVEGALPGERVLARIVRRKPSFDVATVERVIKPSAQRVVPPCPNFGVCGGCAMQHLDASAQVAIKQRALEDTLWHIGKVKPQRVLAPMHGPTWGYRYRARFSVRLVSKKGGVLVGFREKRSRYVADMTQCLVVPAHVSDLLPCLRTLIGALSIPDRIPQIEVSVGDQTTALLMRHLNALTPEDISLLREFADRHGVSWWLQPKGVETAHPLNATDADILAYQLPEFGLRMPYRPTDFTQVNHEINRALIAKALLLLGVNKNDRIVDLFCGLGNFSLPLATRAGSVVGVEGNAALTARANEAATANGLASCTQFLTCDLFQVDALWLQGQGYFHKMLLDPPREGASAVCQALSQLAAPERPMRIVYVSCNPATLARDAAALVHDAGYRLSGAGVVNMFPHTGHVESIAVFDQQVFGQ